MVNEFDAISKVKQGRDQLLGSNHRKPRIWKVYMSKKKKCLGGENYLQLLSWQVC